MIDEDMTEDKQIPATPEQEKAIDDALGIELVKFRMDKGLMDKLRAIAEVDGVVLPVVLRFALFEYVRLRNRLS